MTEGDTLWYHGVFAARFVQEGRLDIFPDLGNAAQGFFPANSQMSTPSRSSRSTATCCRCRSTSSSPALALLAAYCVGRRRGSVAICVIAVRRGSWASRASSGTHPGQATNDVLCATFLLVAVALLVEGGIEPVPLALAGVAAALSLGHEAHGRRCRSRC